MSLPAPARFDSTARRIVRAAAYAALGPLLTIAVLVAAYAFSARACAGGARLAIALSIALGMLGCAVSIAGLARGAAADGGDPLSPGLRAAALGLLLASPIWGGVLWLALILR
jgi:hypothetical protein